MTNKEEKTPTSSLRMARKPTSKGKKLSPKREGFIRDYLATGNASEAARRNYDIKNPSGIGKLTKEILEDPKVISKIQELLGDDDLADKHKQLLSQKRVDYFVFPKNMSDEEITAHVVEGTGLKVINIRNTQNGKMVFYATDDATTQSKALEMAYKIKGTFAPEKTMNVNVNLENREKIQSIAQQVIQKMKEDEGHIQ